MISEAEITIEGVGRNGDGIIVTEVTGGLSLCEPLKREKCGLLDGADRLGAGTPGMKRATCWSRQGAGRLTHQPESVSGRRPFHLRNRVEERSGIGVSRISEDLLGVADFYHLAQIHHGDAVAHVAHRREIMRDHDETDTQLIAQLSEEFQDGRLNRNVQGGHRFIRDNQAGLHGQGASNGDSLTLTSRKRSGVSREGVGRKTDQRQ